MVMQGGCDKSDEFISYRGEGMLFAKTASWLTGYLTGEGKKRHMNPEDDRRIKEVSEILYGTIAWWEFLCGNRLCVDNSQESSFNIVTRLFSEPITSIPEAERSLQPIYRAWHTLNVFVAEQEPLAEDIREASKLCTDLAEICVTLGGDNHRHGCF